MFLPEDLPRHTMGRIGDVPIRVDATFVFVPLFFAGGLTHGNLAFALPYFLITVAGIFVSVLFHEIGHAVAARWYRMTVVELVVGGFYGYARMGGIAPSRRASIIVLLAGPVANLALFAWLWLLLGLPAISPRGFLGAATAGKTLIHDYPILASAARSIARINLAMFIFNLLPAFPLDGGRIAKQLLGHVMERQRGVQLVAASGIAIGLWVAFGGVAGNMVGLLIGLQIAMLNFAIFQQPARGDMD